MLSGKGISMLVNTGGHLLFWGVVFVLFCPPPLGMGAFSVSLFEPEENLWFFLYGFVLNLLLFYGFVGIMLPRITQRRWFPWMIGINVAWWAGFVLLESGLDMQFAIWALKNPGDPEPWTFWEWLYTNLTISGGVQLGANFYSFTAAWFKDRRVQRDLEQEKLRAELKALKHQINPHFLFNVLNSLYGLAFQNDDEPTAEGIARLSQLMRYMLYDSNDAQVNLEKEIEYLENYISLQQLRLDETADIQFEVRGAISGKSIAPMLLIPLVENAFKYGISRARDSYVHIRLEIKPDRMEFQVLNSMHDVNLTNGEVGGIGLENVRKRLILIYPEQHRFIHEQRNHSYFASLTLLTWVSSAV